MRTLILRGGLFYFYKNLYESSEQARYVFPSATLGPATNVPQWWNEEIYQIKKSSETGEAEEPEVAQA